MRLHKFTLTGNRKEMSDENNGHHVIDDKYVFVDGVMKVPVEGGRYRKRILCDFYACECEVINSDDVEAESEVIHSDDVEAESDEE